jgi:hypothetical protein
MCYDFVTYNYTGSDFATITHCLDLSKGDYANSTTVIINYEALSRPDRFNLYINGALSQSSPWLGSDTNYPPGYEYYVPTGVTTNGSFTFSYNPANTYEIRVDVAPENPNNPINDSYQINIACPRPTSTPTPTPTITPQLNLCGTFYRYQWRIKETGALGNDSGALYIVGEYNSTTKTLTGLPSTWTPPQTWDYNGYMEVQIWDCELNKKYIVDKWTTLNKKPTRNWPSKILTNLPSTPNVYTPGLWTVAPYNTNT